jgi:hypothetical protein
MGNIDHKAQKKTIAYDIGNPDPGLGQKCERHKNVRGNKNNVELLA